MRKIVDNGSYKRIDRHIGRNVKRNAERIIYQMRKIRELMKNEDVMIKFPEEPSHQVLVSAVSGDCRSKTDY
jgi:hypothetical protein